jgi:hypothetical protein
VLEHFADEVEGLYGAAEAPTEVSDFESDTERPAARS